MSFDPISYAMGKATGGGGSSVEVESLSITENGTYTADTGKAYSPVTVTVGGDPALPSEYQEVEYLSFTPHAGFLVTIPADAVWEVEVSVATLPASAAQVAFGYRGVSSYPFDFTFEMSANTSNFFGWMRTGGYNTYYKSEPTITLEANKKATMRAVMFGAQTKANIGRYGGSVAGSGNYGGWNGNVHKVRGYDPVTFELLACFVPCYKKADNTIGIYDTVAKVFYDTPDINGGSIAKGPDVT